MINFVLDSLANQFVYFLFRKEIDLAIAFHENANIVLKILKNCRYKAWDLNQRRRKEIALLPITPVF